MRLLVIEDRLRPGDAPLALDPADRIVYVERGDVAFTDAAGTTTRGANSAAYLNAGTLEARTEARVWRWELRATPPAVDSARSTLKLARDVETSPTGALMRCDRVDFPPGGIAYTHTHQGPGIRVLLQGRFRVETGGHTLSLGAGDPWFERGPDPVYAEATADAPASFVRVMVLPVALLGKSSIRYVKPEDLDRPKSQRYTVFVDTAL